MIQAEVDYRQWRAGLVRRLRGAGVDDADREVSVIIRSLCRSPLPAEVHESERAAVAQAVERRGTGRPLAYVLGTAGFRYLDLEVDDRVLIPRPETEELVQTVLDWASRRGGPLRGLEVGVGSGAVVLSLAREGTFTTLVGTDVSRGALAVARQNLGRVGGAQVRLVAGSFLAALRPGTRFDVIVANPPYLTEREFHETDPSVHRFEPREALVLSRDGMAHLDAICRAAASHLAPGGLLALEIDARRARESAALARMVGLADVAVTRDVFGRDRILTATLGS